MAQIQWLPSDVAAQIKASASLGSLNNVVVGLLENALDAHAQRIDIKVDFGRASCWIKDDGIGIATSNFAEDGGLGEPFHTSNIHHRTTNFLGSNGLFLASVAAVSILSITSRSQGSPEANALILRYAQPATRLVPAPEHMSLELEDHGTKVSVHDLFGNMPVRVKQRPSSDEDRRTRDKEWDRLCIAVAGCMLAHGEPLHLTMRGRDDNHVLNIKVNQTMEKKHTLSLGASSRMNLVRSIVQQTFPSMTVSTWVPISARTSTLHIQAIIYSDAVPRRHLQFVCIGNRYVPPDGDWSILYESINRVFDNSSFGKVDLENQSPRAKDYTRQQQQAYRPTFKHWPAFVMLIKIINPEAVDDNRRGFSTRLAEVATTLTKRFLEDHGYRSRGLTQTGKMVYPAQNKPSLEPAPLHKPELAIRGSHNLTSERGLSSADPFQEMSFDVKLSVDQTIPPTNIVLKDDAVFRSRFISSRNGNRLDPHSSHSLSIPSKEIHNGKDAAKSAELSEPVVDALHEEIGNSDSISAFGETGMRIAQACKSRSNQDERFHWTDPGTRKTFCINARTGCVVKSEDCLRPRTTNDSVSQFAQSRSILGNLPRIIRSADGIAPPKDDTWAKRFLENWRNPVLENVQSKNSASEFHFHNLAQPASIEDDGSLFSHVLGNQSIQAELRMQRTGLKNAVVISQVDSKFILLKIRDTMTAKSKNIVVLVDQHAADERIRVEQLLKQLCSKPSQEVSAYVSPLRQRSAIDTVILHQPVILEVKSEEHELFKRSASYFAQWGILCDISPSNPDSGSETSHGSSQLTILSLPSAIAQRCSTEPQLLLNLLRSEVWKEEERAVPKHHKPHSIGANWVTQLRNCPSGILDLVNSRACRSAVMFNDVLTILECRKMISDLAECQFPFQCAHGRPSMVPLLHISDEIEPAIATARTDKPDDFSKAWKTWIGRE